MILLPLLFSLGMAHASFNPALDANDEIILHYLLQELPGEITSGDASRIAAVEGRVASFAAASRARSRADLAYATGVSYWANSSAEPKWMVAASQAMVNALDSANRGTAETAAFTSALTAKQLLLERAESSLNTADPANVPKLAAALDSVIRSDGHKLSEIYLRLRALCAAAGITGVMPGIPLSRQELPGLDSARWEASMAEAFRRATTVAGALPVSVRASFVKSVGDIFYGIKFPLLDQGYDAIVDPVHPNPGHAPTAGGEALSSLRSLERVLLALDSFRAIDQAGGARAYLRGIQPRVAAPDSVCSRVEAAFTPVELAKLRALSKVIVLDPGHLGGDFADDGRDISPANEKGQESYGYREGHDTFLIANLARRQLTRCLGLPEANVLLTRRGLLDEGGVMFDKSGNVLRGAPSETNKASDNLYFRKVVVTMAQPDLVISMHTDYSDTLTQHGLIMIPRAPAGLEDGFYKSRSQYAASTEIAQGLARALDHTMFSREGTPSGKSAHDFLGFEFREYYLKEMDLQIFRDFVNTPVALVEGYDYASPKVRALMNAVARGHLANDPDVSSFTADGARFYFHTVHQSYAEGVAIAAAKYLLGN